MNGDPTLFALNDRLAQRLKSYRGWVHRLLRPQVMRPMAMFGAKHSLPDFLIIGAPKCGTTSLLHYLAQHPGIVASRVKEVGFFSQPKNFGFGENWYRAHFPTYRHMRKLSDQLGYPACTGEATPGMYINIYAANARALLPRARLIAVLRNPVDRAYSHYRHQVRIIPRETLPLREALGAEQARTAGDLLKNQYEPASIGRLLGRFGYTYNGKYIDQIEHWLKYFPREQLKIIRFEKLASDPQAVCNDICRFLGLPPCTLGSKRPLNSGGYAEPMEDRCRDYLTELFRPYNRRLFEFLGEDWGWPA